MAQNEYDLNAPSKGNDNRAAGLKPNTEGVLDRLADLERQISVLQRTAPGRGNVLLSDNRVLTRFSLPPHFEHNEPIYIVNADDRLILPKLAMCGYYELPSTRFVLDTVKAGQHVVDVGANFGYYSILFAALVGWKGKVVAFEPQAQMHALLSENVLANWVDQWVQVVNAACSEQTGVARFFTCDARAGNTGPSIPEATQGASSGASFYPIDVATVRLDESTGFLDGRVDFLKIDVEGGEPLVLRGAEETIASNPQITILMEWSPMQLRAAGHDVTEFSRSLGALGLTCFGMDWNGALIPLAFDLLAASDSYQNVVLRHRS